MKLKEIQINKRGKLFYVNYTIPIAKGHYVIAINDKIVGLVNGDTPAKFESYLRKSFRNFYNLDKKLKARRGTGKTRLKINTSDWLQNY